MPVLKNGASSSARISPAKPPGCATTSAVLVKELEQASDKFEVSKQRYLEREARKAESISAAKALKPEGTLTRSRH